MDSATEDIYLQKLQEFVYDEEKIVTCRWLSLNLNISINKSKHLLDKYISDIKDRECKDATVSYLLSGIAPGGDLHVTIVKDKDLQEKQAAFSKILDQQIYSVQKCVELDINTLGLIDGFDIHNSKEMPLPGSIRSQKCVQRIFKTKTPVASVQKPSVPASASIFASKSNASSSSKDSNIKQKKTNGMNNFFTKSTSQETINSNTSKAEVKPISPKTEIKSETQKSDEKSQASKTNSKSQASKTTLDKTASQKRIANLIDSESDCEEANVKSQNQNVKTQEEKKPRRSVKRSQKNKSNAPSPKRRKRIVEQESDSDDMFGSDPKEDIEESGKNSIPDDSEEDVPKTKLNLPLAPKNKKRKQIDRTYNDEDGYIITTKEWVEESPSEDEVIAETPQKKIKNIGTKTEKLSVTTEKKPPITESSDASDTNNKDTAKIANGKSKGGKKGKKVLSANQPTIMNFFKRT